MRIVIIGAGNMGMTYAHSFLKSKVVTARQLTIVCRDEAAVSRVSGAHEAEFVSDASACLPLADIVILAVKPQDAPVLFEQIKPLADPEQLCISIMAGVRTEAIRSALGYTKIIRAMPNLPAQIGQGVTAFTSSEEVTRLELVMVQNLLSTTGKTLYVAQEDMIDASTAISGSGPAYVYFFMKAMIDAAAKMGFEQSEAEMLVAQTFSGALDLYNKENYTCDEWIAKVASKGGTTEAALHSFEQHGLYQAIVMGANAALDRASDLGKKK
jgi:pyrroline-5-carboxylate reductase